MSDTTSHAAPRGRYLFALSLSALGVVYGDIGTSPLYAMRECFHGPHAIEPTPENVTGVISLIFWSLAVVISIKYLVFVMRADNRGEGGILSLTALVTPLKDAPRGWRYSLIALGLFGTALLYGDGIITPAISVLSAVEGLKVATPLFEPYVLPITVVILLGLFLFQYKGTAGIGAIFGPVMCLWFVTLAALGVAQAARHPAIFAAVNPAYGFDFFTRNGWHGFLVLGSVFLVVTGGEALYADMGHFGRRPIRVAWFALVFPALLLNYFGQGALLVENPAAAENPFYRLAPTWALYPMVVLSTAATIIASQALITGAFSLTRQAIQLGFCPRLRIEHTSATEIGQIYLPSINWALMVACVALVLGFRTSSNLAAAYGVAVTATMAITTILFFVLISERWRWNFALALLMSLVFLVIDCAFFGANIVKIWQGGWFPLAVGAIVFTLLTTWKKGRQILAERLRETTVRAHTFVADVRLSGLTRVPGTAVFMYSNEHGIPPALLSNIEHNKVLHEQVVILVVVTKDVSHVPPEERLSLEELGEDFYRLKVSYGFMDDPDIPVALKQAAELGLKLDPAEVSYFFGRETLIVSERPGMALWREKLFALMSRNAHRAMAFFRIPSSRVIELGTQVEI
jgi:KUP system potassium uptake protein